MIWQVLPGQRLWNLARVSRCSWISCPVVISFHKTAWSLCCLLLPHVANCAALTRVVWIFLHIRKTLMRLFWCTVSPVLLGFVASVRHSNCSPLSITKLVGSLFTLVFRFSCILLLMFHCYLTEREKIIFLTVCHLTDLKKLHYDFFSLVWTSTHYLASPTFQYLLLIWKSHGLQLQTWARNRKQLGSCSVRAVINYCKFLAAATVLFKSFSLMYE